MGSEPIFIVGCGRSGTTLVYEALARHPETAWFSTWTDRSGRAELAAFNGLFKRGRHSRRFGPRPSEGYRLWDAAVRLPAAERESVLGTADTTPEAARRVGRVIDRHLRFGGGGVFVNKNTRNSRRVAFLNQLYPRARFVHVVRDPLDTASSLLAARWWPGLRLWWRDGASPGALSDGPVAEARLAAELWTREVGSVRDAAAGVPAARFTEVRYEEVVAAPGETIGWLLERLELAGDGDAIAGSQAGEVSRDSVGAHRSRLTSEQARAARATVGELASELGYRDAGHEA